MLKYIITGRKNSGRKLFIEQLKKSNFKIAKSYSTREKTDENDDANYFISKEEASEFKNKILETEHENDICFYTSDEIEKSDILSLDIKQIYEITKLYPDDVFRIICIMAANDKRLISAVKNEENKITAEENFKKLCVAENAEFEEFEDKLTSCNLNIDNVYMAHIITNDFTQNSDIFNWTEQLDSLFRQFKRVSKMITEIVTIDSVTKNDDGSYVLFIQDPDNPLKIIEKNVSLDTFTETMLSDNEGLARVVSAWLKLEKNSFKDD